VLEKIEILVVIFALLLLFYGVIALSAGRGSKSKSPEIKNYLFSVKVLIVFLALVSLILWMFI
tara:strand:+ start:290 stop:478 length:189 start_codon:yes stop_codon:yes gene_type:complete